MALRPGSQLAASQHVTLCSSPDRNPTAPAGRQSRAVLPKPGTPEEPGQLPVAGAACSLAAERGEGGFNCQTPMQTLWQDPPLYSKLGPSIRGSSVFSYLFIALAPLRWEWRCLIPDARGDESCPGALLLLHCCNKVLVLCLHLSRHTRKQIQCHKKTNRLEGCMHRAAIKGFG